VHHAAKTPASTHPNEAKDALQAETVTFIMGSFLKVEFTMKVALVYRVRTLARAMQTGRDLDATEQPELVNAYWMVYYMDLCWTVTTGFPSVSPNLRFGEDQVSPG